jgi:ABC-type branched-subunit amino acid transport system substrate-binding protein
MPPLTNHLAPRPVARKRLAPSSRTLARTNLVACVLALCFVAILLRLPSAGAASIYLGHMRPMSGTWAGGPQMEAAVEMAFEDVNADPAVLPSHTLSRVIKDSLCQAGEGLKGLITWINDKNRRIVGIVGAGCSAVSTPLTSTANLFNLMALSPSSGSISLSNKQMYPSFMRTISSQASLVSPTIAICNHFKWRRVALVTETNDVMR